MHSAFPALILMLAHVPAAAQIETDTQLWTKAEAGIELSRDVELDMEAHLRFGSKADGVDQVQLGGWLTHDADGLTLSGGYIRVWSYDRGALASGEHRLRQQVAAGLGSIGRAKLSGRLRLEQRFRSDGGDTGWRLRPQAKLALPLREGGKSALVLSHEAYFDLNATDWGQDAGYRRMRNFLGVTAPLGGKLAIEAGYLNQYHFRDRATDRMDHIFSVGLGMDF